MVLLDGAQALPDAGLDTTLRRRLKPIAVSSPDGSQSAIVPPPEPATVPTGTGIKPPLSTNVAPAGPSGQVAPTPGMPVLDYSAMPVSTMPVLKPAPTGTPLPGIPAPAPTPAAGLTPTPGAAVQTITGNELPQTITPQRSDALQQLLARVQQGTLDWLDNPDVYGGKLFEESVASGERMLDEQFGRQRQLLEADLARRGLDYSSVAGGNLSDLATERARASEDLIRPLLRERALAAGSARQAALSGARGVAGDIAGLESMERGELRGERGYIDELRQQARDQAIQEFTLQERLRQARQGELQTQLAQALAASNPALAAQLLSQAGGTSGAAAGGGGGSALEGLGPLLGLLGGFVF